MPKSKQLGTQLAALDARFRERLKGDLQALETLAR